jgi:TPP-dependent pyruvate/acetoin dehydrogenase alpha subunit
MSAEAILAEHYGKVNGGAEGFAGFHYADLSLGIPGMGGMVGGEFTLAAGVAIAFQLRGAGQVAVCCFGDGATGRGTFHEAMLMSATWKLPVVWFCENNRYQQWTCIDVTHPKEDIVDFGGAYDIPSAAVDGQDVMAVYEAVAPAVDRAREGKGPTLIEAKTFRYRPHVEGFPDYSVGCQDGVRSEAEVKQWKERDPILLFKEVLLEHGVLSGADIEEIDRTAELEMDEAQRSSQEASYPGPEVLDRALYAE